MADHLRLPSPHLLDSRRRASRFDPNRGPVEPDRPGHARTLAGVLEGLGLPHPGLDGGIIAPVGEAEEADSRIVLVFEGRAALADGPFRRWSMRPLAEGAGNTYMVMTDLESRRAFAELVSLYGGNEDDWDKVEAWRQQLDAIKGVHVYGREERASSDLDELTFAVPEIIDVLLWPSTLELPTRRQAAAIARVDELRGLVAAAAERNGMIRVATFDERPETTTVRVVADRVLLEAILEHPWVERVRPPVRPHITHPDLWSAQVPEESPSPAGSPVGVIDDLVTRNALLEGVISGSAAFPQGYTFGPHSAHGTQVAGVAAYGDLRPLVTAAAGLPDPHPVFAARIMQQDPQDASRAIVVDLLHEQLERALRWLHDNGVRIAVCSINTDIADSRPLPSESTATLDHLARELDMVIVVSAGNVRDVDIHPAHWRTDYPAYLDDPRAGIAEPGAAALAITVGAMAKYDAPGSRGAINQIAIAPAGGPSPFTRVGPTRGRTAEGTLKPEFAAHGGNYAWDSMIGRVGRDPAMGVITLAPAGAAGGQLLSVVDGTSFAAPYVAHELATIATRYPGASANLLRALAALSASPSATRAPALTSGVTSAYGEPRAEAVLESGSHRLILTFEGTMPINSTIIHEIPVPTQFATGQFAQRLAVALAFDPPVRRSRRAYAAGDMTFDAVRNLPLDRVREIYQRQPTTAEALETPDRVRIELPSDRTRPPMQPGSQAFASNTMIRRTLSRGWDADDEGYYLVVTHSARAWAVRKDMPEQQSYALAVQLTMHESARVDLYALVQAQLRARIRGHVRYRDLNPN